MKFPQKTEGIGSGGRVLMVLGAPPWDGLYFAGIGLLTIPLLSWFQGNARSGWWLVPFLLAVMLAVRIIPAILRHLLPFPAPVLAAWADRRQISKHYDSYQWRKMFWIGLGLALFVAVSRQVTTPRIVVALVCILSGVLGLVRWRAVSTRTDSVKNWETGRNSASFSNLASK